MIRKQGPALKKLLANTLACVFGFARAAVKPIKKSLNFTISIPAGLIVDMNNNPTTAMTVQFTNLSQNTDTASPKVVAVDP